MGASCSLRSRLMHMHVITCARAYANVNAIDCELLMITNVRCKLAERFSSSCQKLKHVGIGSVCVLLSPMKQIRFMPHWSAASAFPL